MAGAQGPRSGKSEQAKVVSGGSLVGSLEAGVWGLVTPHPEEYSQAAVCDQTGLKRRHATVLLDGPRQITATSSHLTRAPSLPKHSFPIVSLSLG